MIPVSVRNLLRKIHAREPHRCAHATYEYATQNGLAYYESYVGWHLTELGHAEIADFLPQEIAYRIPGEAWKRRTAKTRSAFERAIEQLTEKGAEIQTRPLR